MLITRQKIISEPKEIPCAQNLHKLIITNPTYGGNVEDIIFIRCCLKEEVSESLYTQNIREFSNLSKQELEKIINSVNFKVSANHDNSIYPYSCRTTKKFCDYEKFKINFITVAIQYQCNLKCIMCTHGVSSIYNNLDAELYKRTYFNTLYNIKNMKLDTIELTQRGEPFFYKKETFDYIRSLTLNDCKKLHIITNATMLNSDDIYELYNISKTNHIIIALAVSCSGITAETYKTIHKNNNFEKVVNNIKLLNNLGMLYSINYVIQEENYYELDLIKDFWKAYNIDPRKITLILKDGKPLPDSKIMEYVNKILKEKYNFF